MIEKKLGSILNQKGFYYDKKLSKPTSGLIVYAKGEQEPEDDWYLHDSPPPNREEIWISRHRWFPAITVRLRSLPKKSFTDLWHLAGSFIEKWWPIATEEEMEKSIDEIGELLQKYAWDWFVLD